MVFRAEQGLLLNLSGWREITVSQQFVTALYIHALAHTSGAMQHRAHIIKGR